jgi:DNA-binding GntR family transcriptional regulator
MTNDSAVELLDNTKKLERTFLKDQATNLLRERIIRGQISSGSKLTERDTALLLGISRAPARDALLELEKEGLVISKSDGRYVIELTERDIRELYAVRLNLEKMAVGLAAQNASPESRAALLALLESMRQGVANHSYQTFVQTDVEMHRLIWVQSNNRHLVRILESLMGPRFICSFHAMQKPMTGKRRLHCMRRWWLR